VGEEKKEQPTEHKIRKAREDGQVPISRDFGHLATLLGVGEVAFMTESYWREAIHSLMLMGIARVGQPFLPAFAEMMGAVRILLFVVFFTLFVLCTVIAFAANWGQFGPLISTKSIKLDFNKLNPVNGIKQLFSEKKLVELLMTSGKGILVTIVMYYLIRDELANILMLSGGTPKDVYQGFIQILRTIFHIIVGMFMFIALIDLIIQKALHIKSLRMDMEEIKKEMKENEGDPLIKGTRKQMAREQAMSDPVTTTAQASALVVNPTHFAIGLFYDADKAATVPIVISKGKDEVAQAMIRMAKKCGIPVIRHVWLARTLYATCQPFTVIPRSSYDSVAQVFAVVMELYKMDEQDRSFELESDGNPPDSEME